MKIIDLAVEGDPHGIIFIGHGLMAQRGQVDDGQPDMPQTHIILVPNPLVIRTAVGLDFGHPLKQARVHLTLGVGINNAANATHEKKSPVTEDILVLVRRSLTSLKAPQGYSCQSNPKSMKVKDAAEVIMKETPNY